MEEKSHKCCCSLNRGAFREDKSCNSQVTSVSRNRWESRTPQSFLSLSADLGGNSTFHSRWIKFKMRTTALFPGRIGGKRERKPRVWRGFLEDAQCYFNSLQKQATGSLYLQSQRRPITRKGKCLNKQHATPVSLTASGPQGTNPCKPYAKTSAAPLQVAAQTAEQEQEPSAPAVAPQTGTRAFQKGRSPVRCSWTSLRRGTESTSLAGIKAHLYFYTKLQRHL